MTIYSRKSNNVNKSWMRFDMLLVWSQWLLASQAVLENAWEQDDDLARQHLRGHHDHDTRDDHDGRDNLSRMPHSLKRVKNELIHSQYDIASLLLFITPIIVLYMISGSDS